MLKTPARRGTSSAFPQRSAAWGGPVVTRRFTSPCLVSDVGTGIIHSTEKIREEVNNYANSQKEGGGQGASGAVHEQPGAHLHRLSGPVGLGDHQPAPAVAREGRGVP